jgi:methionyl-tRNA formyltransferase
VGRESGRSRIIFAGSPDFAVPTLRALVGSAHPVIAVLTQPDRRSGRGHKLQQGPVKEFAVENGIDVLQPLSLAGDDISQTLQSLQPDLMVVVAYGMLLPETVLSIPTFGCVNVHASLLPRWRGASPIQAAILAGDPITGISVMRMAAGLDTGPVYASAELPIGDGENAGQLHDRLANAGAELLLDTLDSILDGSAATTVQAEAEAVYAGRINKSDGDIDWALSAVEIDRRIRAYNPWPVADTSLDGIRMRCWAGEIIAVTTTAAGECGEVIAVQDSGIDVRAGHGVLRLTRIQMPGKRQMSAAEFANGYPVLAKVLGR